MSLSKFISKPYILTYSLLFATTSCLEYNPHKQEVPLVKSWKTKQNTTEPAAKLPEEHKIITKWWLIFEDPELNRLQEMALKQSPTLQLAAARLQEAQAFFTVQKSATYPDLNLAGVANRQHFPKTTAQSSRNSNSVTAPPSVTSPNAASSSSSVIPSTTTPATTAAVSPASASNPLSTITASPPKQNQSFLQVAPVFSYEVDFWGRYSKATAAAYADVKAAEEALRTAYLLLTTQIAETYFDLQSQDAKIKVLTRTITSYEKEVSITSTKYTSGLSSALDFVQAEVELSTVQADLEATKNTRMLAENLLATLVGMPASSFTLPEQDFNPKFPHVPEGLPSEILVRRPDVKEAENHVEAARLTVGVAKTAFFPSITLTGAAGYQSNQLSSLFKWKNHVLSGTTSLLQPIFDGGYNLGNLRQAKAQYKQNVAIFLNTVINAYREVEDALYTYEAAKKQYMFREIEVRSAKKLLNLTSLQYENGLIDYLNVIFAERTALTAETDSIKTTREKVFAIVDLIKSLGGTW
ncbi:MAG: outer membrane protein [Chlamydiia bacterium]|nr:outer membrane protein [Chlamydiia bacterium]